MSTLERAIAIAAEAHAGQVDKAGAPYILHPLRVMLAQTTDDARIVGVLHDVVEDCDGWSFARLKDEGFSTVVIDGVDAVTKRPEDEGNYSAFIARGSKNPIGRLVKLADLRDNADLARIAEPTERDRERVAKYQQAIDILSAAAISEPLNNLGAVGG